MNGELGHGQHRNLDRSRNRLEKCALDAARLLWLGMTVAGLSAFLASLPAVMAPYLQPSGLVLFNLKALGNLACVVYRRQPGIRFPVRDRFLHCSGHNLRTQIGRLDGAVRRLFPGGIRFLHTACLLAARQPTSSDRRLYTRFEHLRLARDQRIILPVPQLALHSPLDLDSLDGLGGIDPTRLTRLQPAFTE